MRTDRIRTFLDFATAVCVVATSVAVAITLVAIRRSASGLDLDRGMSRPVAMATDKPVTVALDNAAVLGPRNVHAPVIVEFSDFQCPFCGKFARDSFPVLRKEFIDNGQLTYAFMNFPLERIHSSALQAAQAAFCAHAQGGFWLMHDLLFHDNRAFASDRLISDATAVGLNMERFNECLSKTPDAIRATQEIGRRVGVVSTPTFFLGRMSDRGAVEVTRIITGAQEYVAFKSAIESFIHAN